MAVPIVRSRPDIFFLSLNAVLILATSSAWSIRLNAGAVVSTLTAKRSSLATKSRRRFLIEVHRMKALLLFVPLLAVVAISLPWTPDLSWRRWKRRGTG